MLQDCFGSTDSDMFEDLEEQTASVLGYITSAQTVTTQRTVKVYPDPKSWINSTLRELLKERDAAFRPDDRRAYSDARGKLKRSISDDKRQHKQHIEQQQQQPPL